MDNIDLDCIVDRIIDDAGLERNSDSRELARRINKMPSDKREAEITAIIQAIRFLAPQTGRWPQ